ncbi:hypothetical protein [Alteribacillus sp. YIM 98480]|uniref:hypothetical protein n=1 Tax=Alteribacillus sp. YIM 98480 TaxID=2606599 RepID=UPI00131D3504|nr:hypothetical protein [Alteribacillus sp. YIM 98480]
MALAILVKSSIVVDLNQLMEKEREYSLQAEAQERNEERVDYKNKSLRAGLYP